MAKSNMTKAEAESILGLTGKYDAASARRVYRDLVKKNHPDIAVQNGVPKDVADRKMAEINSAWAYIDDMLKFRGSATASKENTYTPPKAQTTTSSTYTYTPPKTEPFSTYSYQPPSEPEEKAGKSHVEAEGFGVRAIRWILNLPLWRIGFVVLAFGIFQLTMGVSFFEAAYDTRVAAGKEDLFFAMLGLVFASFVNLIFGFVTDPARQSCLWLVDKVTGIAGKEPSVRYAIFGHLPYRILFLAFAMWQYWAFTQNPTDGPLDWVFRVLLFFVAALNFLVPVITAVIRRVLVGSAYTTYDTDI